MGRKRLPRVTVESKRCSQCKETQPASEYTIDRRATTGLQPQCNPCRRAAKREAYRRDPEGHANQVRRSRAKDPIHTREVRHREYMRAREKRVVSATKWAQDHPERRREIVNRYKRRRRAAQMGVPIDGDATLGEIWDRDGGVCYLCDKPVDGEAKSPHPASPSLDHIIPLSRGGSHSPDNLGLTHLRCNQRKATKSAEEFRKQLEMAAA